MADEQKPRRHHVLRAETGRYKLHVNFGTMRKRQLFAALHLVAAATFSRRVGEIEQQHQGHPWTEFFSEIMSYAPACVLSSVAGLESYVNELFVDRKQNFPAIPSAVADMVWELTERASMFDKFDVALTFLGKQRIDRSTQLSKRVTALVRLRNALVHFKPEWDTDDGKHKELSELLSLMFKGRTDWPASERMFPTKWMTHTGTAWAVSTALDFIRWFEEKAGGKSKLSGWESQLNP